MKFRRIPIFLAVLMASAFAVEQVNGQVARPTATATDFRVRDIKKDLIKAPTYGAGTSEIGGGRPSTLHTDWLRIEAQFESRPEWADDVTVKFHVLMGDGADRRLFSGEMTHINVQKGQQHYSAMYMHPNTVRRFGNGRVVAVAVQLFYQGRLMDQRSEPTSNERWWEKFSPTAGYVLSPLQTPWAPLAPERYAPIKPTP